MKTPKNIKSRFLALGMISACSVMTAHAQAAVPAAPRFTAPQNGKIVNKVAQNIAGVCVTGNPVRLTGAIVGSPVNLTCAGNRFSHAATLSSGDGQKTITAIQSNSDGASPAASVSLVLDTVKPAPPTVSRPAANAEINTATVAISGGCENNAVVGIGGNVVGGTVHNIPCNNGAYSHTVEVLPGNGNKTINIFQKDRAGNRSDNHRLVVALNIVTAPPRPTVTAPANNVWVNNRTQTIAGGCVTGNTIQFSGHIESAPLTTPCSANRYSRAVTLTSGDARKVVKIVQVNAEGTSFTVNRGINLDMTAPTAPTITSLNNNATVSAVAQTVAGACETGATITIAGQIVGSPLTVNCANAQYTRSVSLVSGNGNKTITVTQRDMAGNTSSARNITVILGTPSTNPDWGPRNSNRLLLSGHSLVDNPLVDYVEDITRKASDSFNYNQQIVIGSPIRVRTRGMASSGWSGYSSGKNKNNRDNMNVINEVRNPQTLGAGERYDTLVITENHSVLAAIQWENTTGFLRHYHDLMISGNPATRTFFYHSWLDINKSNPTQWIAHEKNAAFTWECVVSKVNQSIPANRTDRLRLLPAGGALIDLVERVVANQVPEISGTTANKMNMLFVDNVHMTRLGNYYLALVVYSSIYGKSAVGTAPPSEVGISTSLARSLQTIAWNYVNSYYSQSENPAARTMASCRNFIANNTCSTYWALQGSPGETNSCRNFYSTDSTDNPFRNAPLVPYAPAW